MSRLAILKPTLEIGSTQNMLLDSVRKFCRSELVNYTSIHGNKDSTRRLYKKFGNLGLLGPTIKGFNCLGESYKLYGLMAKEIEYIDSGFRSMYSVQSSLVMNPIYYYGSQSLKEKYLPGLASGDMIGSFGLTESESGSDASAMKTYATKVRDDFVINGSKAWITNSPVADVFVVWARFDGAIHGFVLDRSMSGIETPEISNKLSLKSSLTGMIYLDNVRIPKENKLNIVGMKGPLSCLNNARLGISFGVLGASEFCLENVLEYAQTRQLFGSSLAEKQLFQSRIADMVTRYNLGLLASLEVAEKKDEGGFTPEMISMVKRNNCESALDIARICRDMLGGNGITEDYNIFRHMVNLETVKTYEGTHDIHGLILGSYITNKKAF